MGNKICDLCGIRNCPVGPWVTPKEFYQRRIFEISKKLQTLGKELQEMES